MATSEVQTLAHQPDNRRASLLSQIEASSRWFWVSKLVVNPFALASLIVLIALLSIALFAPWLAPYDPSYINPRVRLEGPSLAHWFGTDDSGRDILSRVMFGARTSLVIGFSVTLVAALIGSILGLVSGYFSRLDSLIMRVMDGLMAIPGILLAIAIMAVRGPSSFNVFLALVVVYTPAIARLVRSTTLVLKQHTYVESARAIGLQNGIILYRYIFQNSLSPLIVQCTFIMAFSIVAEASLSFLGAGVPPQIPTWGNMLRDGQRVVQSAWWLAVVPGVALVIAVLTLNLLGDALRDVLDPRSREG